MFTNKELITNILNLISEEGLTAKEFAQAIGRKSGIITDWKSNRSSPTISDLVVICTTYNCPIEKLIPELSLCNIENHDLKFIKQFETLSETDKKKVLHFIEIASMNDQTAYEHADKRPSYTNPIVQEENVYSVEAETPIPILGKVAAGEPILSYKVDFGSVIPENKNVSYALIAQGDSMEPVILDKETIEVISQKELHQGEIGIIRVNEDVTCKKFYNFPDHYELRSINPNHTTIAIEKSPSTNLQILGKVALTKAQMKRF